MKCLELTIPGRPVPWARMQISKNRSKTGKPIMFTAKKQEAHRKVVEGFLKDVAYHEGIQKFEGPCYLQLLFVYGKQPETWVRLYEIDSLENLEPSMPYERGEEFRAGRPDIDNLIKQLMEAIEDSGVLVGEDGQISMVMAAKVKR